MINTRFHNYFFNPTTGLVFLFLTAFLTGNAQKGSATHYDIKWLPPVKEQVTDKEIVQVLKFENGVYRIGNDLYPRMVLTLPYTFNGYEVNAAITNTDFESLKEDEAVSISKSNDLSNEIQITTHILKERNQSQLMITLLPLRKNPQTKQAEKLLSFDLVLKQGAPIVPTTIAVRNYASNSVLSSGTWYKFSVIQNGVHKVTYNFLRSLGIDPSTVSFQSLRLFGNGGGMVPQWNALPRIDDLAENAIKIVDVNGNGIFNTDDYFLFYGESPHQWAYDATDKHYHHQKNIYSDSTYYFLTTDASISTPAKRISQVASLPSSPNDINVTSFTDYDYHEEDLQNFIKSGREWFGEQFSVNLNQRFTFSFPNLIPGVAYLKSSVMARTVWSGTGVVSSQFKVVKDGTTILTQSVSNITPFYLDDFGRTDIHSANFAVNSPDINLDYNFVPYPTTSASGWLNYIELNASRNLTLSSSQFFFRDQDTSAILSQRNYNISNAKAGLTLWNTTDPNNITEQQFILNGTQLNFTQQLNASSHAEYVLFDGNSFYQPVATGKIENQNLHGLPQADMIIVAFPDFVSEAQRLADFHHNHDNLKVVVATTDQVYNEFGSGALDISAIRDFAKMFYDRGFLTASLDTPRYLLLFGDGSYDPKMRIGGNSNFVPTYQSDNSISYLSSFTADDFFGLVSDNDGLLQGPELMDIGVGRFPVKNLKESKSMVDKVITYSTPGTITDNTYCAGNNSTRFGDWRNTLCFIADDGNGGLHLSQSERVLSVVKNAHPEYNIDKIYFDAYKEVSTPGGLRYPEVNDGITRRVEKGAMLINYTGHGGEVGWADEGVLNIPMINGWNNLNNLPAFITATCEFSRFDDPQRTSAGELVLLNSTGGGICLFTTVRLALSGDNESLNTSLIKYMFKPINGEMPRLGDLQRLTKRENSNIHNLDLLGDPALRLAYPQYKVSTTSIINTATGFRADTISALSRITVKGVVTDNNGQTLTSFNGVVYPTIYDKEIEVHTLGNNSQSPVIPFKLRKNIFYRGKASVVNGVFSSSFIVPKDIAYQYGSGRLSYYAHNGVTDANGWDTTFVVGGVSNTALNDTKGPGISLYMNDDKFVFGGLTDENPKVFALLIDSSGINTVGNGIGHDITATLDHNPQQLYVMNDYYESDLDNYQKGRVVYSLNGLSEGRHSLQLKAWDINNNSSDAYTEFVVASSANLALDHVLNYPNPFTTHTTFMFEHNKPCQSMTVQVQVYTVTGKLIKTLYDYKICDGYRNNSIEWDGRDEYGDPIGKGVYVYRLKVKTADGDTAEKFERLVILK